MNREEIESVAANWTINRDDPLSTVLAMIPGVEVYARYLHAARRVGAYSTRMDVIQVNLTVNVSAIVAEADRLGLEMKVPAGALEALKSRIEFQVNSSPAWVPVCVDVPETVTSPGVPQ